MVTTSCTITASSVDPQEALEVIVHQIASCEFIWYTFRRELPSEEGEYGEFAEQVFLKK